MSKKQSCGLQAAPGKSTPVIQSELQTGSPDSLAQARPRNFNRIFILADDSTEAAMAVIFPILQRPVRELIRRI